MFYSKQSSISHRQVQTEFFPASIWTKKNIFKSYIVFLSSVLAFEYLSFVIHSYLTLNPHLAFIMFIPNSFNMFCLSVILVSWLFFFTIKDNTLRRYIGHLKNGLLMKNTLHAGHIKYYTRWQLISSLYLAQTFSSTSYRPRKNQEY